MKVQNGSGRGAEGSSASKGGGNGAHVLGGDGPDLRRIDPVVVMGEQDPQPGDVSPRHRGMTHSGFVREAGGCLPDDLEEPFGSPAEDRVRVEGLSTSIDDVGQLV